MVPWDSGLARTHCEGQEQTDFHGKEKESPCHCELFGGTELYVLTAIVVGVTGQSHEHVQGT